MSIAEILEGEESINKRVSIILGSSDSDIPVNYLKEAVRYLDREVGDHLNAARLCVRAKDYPLARSLYDLAVKNKWFDNRLDEADFIIQEARSKNIFTDSDCDNLRTSGSSFCSQQEC